MMGIQHNSSNILSGFLQHLAKSAGRGEDRLPSLAVLSKELGISIASLREQLEIARVLGFVEIKPKTGIRWLPYQFAPSVLVSCAYAIELSSGYFDQFRDLRNHLESAYFLEAVKQLTKNEIGQLLEIVDAAEYKIESYPPVLPHIEHRDLHLLLFSHVENVFLNGILEVYWEIYESQGYSIVNNHQYLKSVWGYHRQVCEAIKIQDFDLAFQLFREHKELIRWSPKVENAYQFE